MGLRNQPPTRPLLNASVLLSGGSQHLLSDTLEAALLVSMSSSCCSPLAVLPVSGSISEATLVDASTSEAAGYLWHNALCYNQLLYFWASC